MTNVNFESNWVNQDSFTGQQSVMLGDLLDQGFDIQWHDVINEVGLWNTDYESRLIRIFTSHFWYREINSVVPARWRMMVNRHLYLILPYYNKLYESFDIKYNPLNTADMHTETTLAKTGDHTQNTDQTQNTDTSGDQSTDTTTRSLYSDTPQTQLQGIEDYASNITDGVSGTTANSTATSLEKTVGLITANDSTMDTFISDVLGHSGILPSTALRDYRNSLLNVDLMFVAEFEQFFSNLWAIHVNGI